MNIMTYLNFLTIKRLSWTVVVITVIAQLFIMIHYWNATEYSDARSYINIAEECYKINTWYPNVKNIYDKYIWSLGIINWLILQLHIFGTTELNPVFNLLFNIGIMFNIYYIGKKFFSKNVGYISVALYSVLYSNLMIVIPTLTEVPYLFFAISAFSLCLKPNHIKLIIAGILFVIANTFRPLAMLFLITTIIYLLLFYRLKFKYFFSLLISIILCVSLVGLWSMKNTGHFIYQSTTGGVNLLIVANDEASFGYIDVFGVNNVGWIENAEKLTYKEKDKIYKERAVNWIINNPGKYIYHYTQRLFMLYSEDSWPDRFMMNKTTLGNVIKNNGITTDYIIKEILPRILKSTFYYIVILLGFYSLIKMKINDLKTPKIVLLILFIMGTCSTCIFHAASRLHHPFIFIIVLWAAWIIEKWIIEYNNLHGKKLYN